MNKKLTIVFIVLIALLILTSGGLGFWSSSLNGRLNTLNDDTLAFKNDTASQFTTTKNSIAGVDSKLGNFETETAGKFTTVQSDITGLDSNLAAFKTSTASRFDTVQSSITGINANVAGLNTNLASLSTQYSESTINVRRVYDDVIDSVVMIRGNITGGTASGSGFIYSTSGSTVYIITCWHVVEAMSTIYVTLHDGRVNTATVVGSDQDSDIAVIKVNGLSNLKPLELADSGTLVAGEPVIIVGSPQWIFETVVSGVISRTKGMVYVSGVGWVANLIQYDAAQNGGNSGGPVFNSEGQVIGIADNSNTAAEGIHYAVSSNKVKRVAEAIIDNGSFTNATLPGTWMISNLTPSVAIDRGLDSAFGIIFNLVTGMGQMQANDIATTVDGMIIKDFADLFSYIAEFRSVGDTITLTLIRGTGTEIEASVVLTIGWLDR